MSRLTSNIRSKLQEKGISVHALEKSAGLKPSAVHNILQGKSKNPTGHTLQAICRALDCQVDELLDNPANHIPPEKSALPWNAELYQEAMNISIKLFKKNELKLGQEKALEFVNEVYLYSLKGNMNKVDQIFAEWLIEKFWSKS